MPALQHPFRHCALPAAGLSPRFFLQVSESILYPSHLKLAPLDLPKCGPGHPNLATASPGEFKYSQVREPLMSPNESCGPLKSPAKPLVTAALPVLRTVEITRVLTQMPAFVYRTHSPLMYVNHPAGGVLWHISLCPRCQEGPAPDGSHPPE